MTGQAATVSEFRRQRDLDVLAWTFLDGLDAEAMVTTRQGGVSSGPYATLNLSLSVGDDPASVLQNRRRVAAALGADLGDFVFARQVHGGRVQIVGAADRGRGTLSTGDAMRDVDALVTRDPGTTLVTMAGDCVPIVLYDPAAHVLASVHAGWRGTVARIAEAALNAMSSLGSRRENVLAGIGPAIAPDRYQVGEEVAAAVRRCLGGDTDGAGILRPDGTGKWLLDLWAANHRMLARAGVPDSQIHVAAVPTGPGSTGPANTGPASTGPANTGQGTFFSDRTARPCGRFALVARLKPRGNA